MNPVSTIEGSTITEGSTIAWRLLITILFVVINGFFVAAEFALVKIRATRIESLAAGGSSSAKVVQGILRRLDLYLSSCQLGITVASLILGWLAEPAIAQLLILLASKAGLAIPAPVLHGVALAIALTVVTILHMTLGEQAPKIWAIQHPETVLFKAAYPLKLFTLLFSPLIWIINHISNALLRRAGITLGAEHSESLTATELRAMVADTARSGGITARQRKFTENILGFIHLEVRHILVPRVDIVWLSLERPTEENLEIIRNTKHSRFPVCDGDLEQVVGILHTKDVLAAFVDKQTPDLRKLAHKSVVVPDTQPLGRLIVELQRARRQCAIVMDERGTAVGMAFLEDALEAIVGPMKDEFDDEHETTVTEIAPTTMEVDGGLPLPEAVTRFGIDSAADDDEDTIGGYVVSLLGRLPEPGDQVSIGSLLIEVTEVEQHRIVRLRIDRAPDGPT